MEPNDRLRLVFFGSGEFGLPTLRRLIQRHEVSLVVTQPDRPAGRGRTPRPTPIAELAQATGLDVFKPEKPNDRPAMERVHEGRADAYVVIAYGHKLSEQMLRAEPKADSHTFAINLHASLLPKFRGAAPVQWAMIHNERETGVSVITLAQRMDAGEILAQVSTPIDPLETAGELEQRLAALGPDVIMRVLDEFRAGTLRPTAQDESLASRAPKLSKADGTLPEGFDQPAELVRARIHGLTPWPGCTVRLGDKTVKLIRVAEMNQCSADVPGIVSPDGVIGCASGAVRILELQPPGGRVMRFDDYVRGHALFRDSDRVECDPL